MSENLVIRREPPDQPEVRALGLGLALPETGRDRVEAVRLRERGAFGDYPDNGLSVFYAKRLERA